MSDQLNAYESKPLKSSRNEPSSKRLPIKLQTGTFVRNAAFDDGPKTTTTPAAKAKQATEESTTATATAAAAAAADPTQELTTSGNLSKLSPHELDRRRYRIKLEMGEICEQILQAPGKAVRHANHTDANV